jgi:hypothetical protein
MVHAGLLPSEHRPALRLAEEVEDGLHPLREFPPVGQCSHRGRMN